MKPIKFPENEEELQEAITELKRRGIISAHRVDLIPPGTQRALDRLLTAKARETEQTVILAWLCVLVLVALGIGSIIFVLTSLSAAHQI